MTCGEGLWNNLLAAEHVVRLMFRCRAADRFLSVLGILLYFCIGCKVSHTDTNRLKQRAWPDSIAKLNPENFDFIYFMMNKLQIFLSKSKIMHNLPPPPFLQTRMQIIRNPVFKVKAPFRFLAFFKTKKGTKTSTKYAKFSIIPSVSTLSQ